MRSLVFTVSALLVGCVRLDAGHCANQDDPVAYCTTAHAMAFCSACRAETDGCRVDRPKTGCEVGSATNATAETSASSADTVASSSVNGESSLGETLGTSSSTTTTTEGDSSTGDPPPGCGNDMIEGTEPCDGTDLARQTCETLSDDYIGGTLGCRPQCDAFDTSLCDLCRMQGDDCDAEHPCCAGLLCGVVTGTCGLL